MSDTPGNAVVDQEKLAAELREKMKAKLGAPPSAMVKLLKSKKFKLPSGEESAGPMKVVVVDFVSFNAYFDRVFKEGDFTPPACFALGEVKPVDLKPSDNSPAKQNPVCRDCWANKFDSHPSGRGGKACGNHYLLGLVEPNANPDSPLYVLRVPSTSLRNWEHYADVVLKTRMRKAPFEVITTIQFDPAKDHQVLMFGEPQINPNVAVHLNRQPEVIARLLTEPDVSGYEPPAKGGPKPVGGASRSAIG